MVDAVADRRQIGFQTGSFIEGRLENLSSSNVFRVKHWRYRRAGPGRTIGKNLIVVVKIGLYSDTDLAKIVHILRYFSTLQNAGIDRISDRYENCDDRHDNEQFEQRESTRKIGIFGH